MPRNPKTIKDIEAQRQRALSSIGEKIRTSRSVPFETNRYKRSQNRAFYTNGQSLSSEGVGAFVERKYNQRVNQINRASDNAINRLRENGSNQRAARRAQGLSVG